MRAKGIFEDESLWTKFLFIILLPIVLGILFMFISKGLTSIFGICETSTSLKLDQTMSALGMFVCSSLLLSYLFSQKPLAYLGIKIPNGMAVLLSIFSMIAVLPLSNYLSSICANISLPEFMAPIEKSLAEIEAKSDKITMFLLSGNSYGSLLVNIFVLAIIPAIGEELLFRGLILKSFLQKNINIHICIWATALLFSLIHVQYHKFIPIMLLGAYFGYLRIWSRSLWLPIAAHFTNNLVIVFYYFFLKGRTFGIDPENIGTSGSPLIITSFAILFFALAYSICMICKKHRDTGITGNEETIEEPVL